MIEISGLSKKYGNNLALNSISFSVGSGEIMGFLGPNGAGKSTMMNILTGYLSATEGECKIDGMDILEHPIEAKKKIGYLPEIPPLYLEMTVLEYLNFIYDLKKCTLNRKKHIAEICEVIKITDVAHRLIGNLSKGYRQRVGIAQALVGNPPVLVFDEPTVGLDPLQIIEIRNLIKSLGRSHTVILSTHILSEVQSVCDRIVVINKGNIVADATAEELEKFSGNTARYRLRVSGASQEVLGALRDISGVISAEKLVEAVSSPDSSEYTLECESSDEIRKNIFFTLAKKDMAILSFEAQSMSLEDVFISLVENSKKNDTEKEV